MRWRKEKKAEADNEKGFPWQHMLDVETNFNREVREGQEKAHRAYQRAHEEDIWGIRMDTAKNLRQKECDEKEKIERIESKLDEILLLLKQTQEETKEV